jgi:hypothetical protein
VSAHKCFLGRRSIFDEFFDRVVQADWAAFARPDTVIKIFFDREELRQLFDSPRSEDILHIIAPQAKEVKDQEEERHSRELRNQQEEAQATTIVKREENRPSAQSKLGKRINFLRRH